MLLPSNQITIAINLATK